MKLSEEGVAPRDATVGGGGGGLADVELEEWGLEEKRTYCGLLSLGL